MGKNKQRDSEISILSATKSHSYLDQELSVIEDQMMSDLSEKSSDDSVKKTIPGIVYLSSVPPFMRPHKLKHLLSQYGAVGRVYLQPEGKCPIVPTH